MGVRDIIIVYGMEINEDKTWTNHVVMYNVCLPGDAEALAKSWKERGWVTRIICGEMRNI